MNNDYVRRVAYILITFSLFIALSYAIVPDSATNKVNFSSRLLPPSFGHILGTDNFGRDLLLMLIAGVRNSLLISLVSLSISLAIGVTLGMIASVVSRRADFLDNVMILLNATPTIFIIAVIAISYGLGAFNIVLAIVLSTVPLFYRIAKSATTNVLVQPYIEALKAVGASNIYILVYHVAKEITPYILSLYVLSIPTAIAIEMSLSFIGLGLEPSSPSLGTIIAWGVTYSVVAPHILVTAIVTIIIMLMVFSKLTEYLHKNFVSDVAI